MNNLPQPTADITDPGVMLANIPGVLGYYPHDDLTIVTLCLDVDDSDDGRAGAGRAGADPANNLANELTDDAGFVTLDMGPIINMGMGVAVDELTRGKDTLRKLFINSRVNYLIALCTTKDDDAAMQLAAEFNLLQRKLLPETPLLYFIQVPEILSGETWTTLWYNDTAYGDVDEYGNLNLDSITKDTPPLNGTIANISTAVATQHRLNDTGDIPQLERNDVLAQFYVSDEDNDVDSDIHQSASLYTSTITLSGEQRRKMFDRANSFRLQQKIVYQYTHIDDADIAQLDDSDKDTIQAIIDEFHRGRKETLHLIQPYLRGDGDADGVTAMTAVLMATQHVTLRDAVLKTIIENPVQAILRLSTVLRTVPNTYKPIRSQLLAMIAIGYIAAEDYTLAAHASRAAVDHDEHNNLAGLVRQATLISDFDGTISSVLHGSTESCMEIEESLN